MSQSYRIYMPPALRPIPVYAPAPDPIERTNVTGRSRENLREADATSNSLVVANIVPPGEVQEILREKLRERGWVDTPGGMKRTKNGVTETLDLQTMVVHAEADSERVLEREESRSVSAPRSQIGSVVADERRRLEEATQITEAEKVRARSRMQREINERLAATEEERMRELNEVVLDVYRESLKRKAATLGTVTEITEDTDGDDFEMVIKITE